MWNYSNCNYWLIFLTSYLFIHLLQQPMKTRGYGMEVTADGPDFTDSPSANQGSQLQCPNCRKYFPHDLLENHMRDCTGDDWIAYICRIMTGFWDCYGQGWSLDDANWQQSRTQRPASACYGYVTVNLVMSCSCKLKGKVIRWRHLIPQSRDLCPPPSVEWAAPSGDQRCC